MEKTNNENSLYKGFNASMYETIEDRNLMHEAICRELREKLSPETYVNLCSKLCIETPYMQPAYGWEP